MPPSVPTALTDAYAMDAAKQMQWNAFVKKNRLKGQMRISFKVLGVVCSNSNTRPNSFIHSKLCCPGSGGLTFFPVGARTALAQSSA